MTTTIAPDTRLNIVLDLAPGVVDYIVSLHPHDFQRLKIPLMRRLMAPRITVERVARMAGVPVQELLGTIAGLTGAEVSRSAPSELPRSPESRPAWLPAAPTTEVNLLPMDEALDADPMIPAMKAVHALRPGEVAKVRHKWEPQPFYDLWTRLGGLEWFSEKAGPEEWWIWVRRKPAS